MVKAVVIMVLWLMASVTVCRSSNEAEKGVESVKERVSEVAGNMKMNIEGAMNNAKDKSGTWADWAMTKVATGLGWDQDEVKGGAHSVVDKASEAASKSTSAMNSVASACSKYVSQKVGEVGTLAFEKAGQAMDKAGDAKETVKDKAAETGDNVNMKTYKAYADVIELAHEALNKAQTMAGVDEETTGHQGGYAYDSISERAGKAMKIGSDTAPNVNETINDIVSNACDHASEAGETKDSLKEKAFDTYDVVSAKGDSYAAAIDSLKENAKETYEIAKDKVHDEYFAATKDKDQAKETYEAAKEKELDAAKKANNAKDSMKEMVKITYEAAKEKTSDAPGEVGEAMRA